MGRDDLTQIGTAHRALGAIDGIGSDKHLRLTSIGQVTAIVLRNHHDNVGLRFFYLLDSGLISGFLALKNEVAARLDAMDELL